MLVRHDRAGTLVQLAPGFMCAVPVLGRVAPLPGAVQFGSGRAFGCPVPSDMVSRGFRMGSVVKKRRKRMAKKKHRKLLRKTRVQRRRLGK
ncbi:hypothetical protein Acsp01_36740 [Actinoplanes sp. NBRC 101535]|nr:hypothetical protein Acsp01_36740 [Actinoplanes sp. NBRC 101535]